MKAKIKRHSRAVISVILAISMLVSCMMVGLIATDAAKVTGDEELGATEYLILSYNSNNITSGATYVSSSSKTFTIKASDFGQTSFETSKNYYIGYSTSNSYTGIYNGGTSVTIGTKDSGISGFFVQDYGGYKFAGFSLANSNIKTVTVTVSGSAPYTYSLTSSTTDSGGSSGGSDPSKGTAPAAVVSGTDIMFYIQGYDGFNKLGNSSKTIPESSIATFTQADSSAYSYVRITKTEAANYQYITNNPGNWDGMKNDSIGSSSAGKLHVGNATVSTTAAKTAETTLSPSSINTGTSSITLSTTCDSATGVYNSLQLYTQYYLDGTYVTGSEATASTSAKSFTLNTSSLSAGSHTLKTILTDGNIFYIADTDTLTVTAETQYTVNISAETGGSVSPNGDQSVGVDTGLSVTATPSTGYSFSSWTKTNVTTSTETATTTVKPTDSNETHSLVANFSKNSYTLTKGAESHGTFTVSVGESTIATSGTVQYDDTITVSCTPATGYYVSTVTAGSVTATETSTNVWTVNMPAADATLNVTFALKTDNAITTSAAPSAGGSVWVASSASGSTALTEYTTNGTVYLRANPNAAYNFTKFVVTYADGTNEEKTTNNSPLTITTDHFDSETNDGSISVVGYFTKKPTHKVTVVSNNNALGTATASVTEAYEGQQVTLTPNEDTGSFSSWSVTSGNVSVSNNMFTMGSSDVAITATFVAYSGTSNFYYNSYGSNGQPAATHYGAQMTEAKIGGQTYSYYHVTDRTETDQLFTVSYKTPAHTGTVYFVTPDGWTDKHGWDSSQIDAAFYASDGKMCQDWTGMTSDGKYGTDRCFKIAIPKGARKVQFRGRNDDWRDNSNCGWPYTEYYDLNDLATNMDCIYISGYGVNDAGRYNNLGAKDRGHTSKPIADGFWEYFGTDSGTGQYTNNFTSGGFNRHGATRADTHNYIKPENLGEAQRGDYYVLVLYKGKSYTINGETHTITNDPEIIWLPELPDSGDTIKVYAKDGAIRDGLNTFANIADTTVYKEDGTTSAGATSYGSGQTYEVYKAQRGETIVVKTTIADTTCTGAADTYRDRYYVRGFCVNGEVPQTLSPNNDGVYTLTYTVPEEYEDKYIEITPIYYLKDTTKYPVVTFRATDFPKNQHNWGNVPYCYPFYGSLSDKDNAFGAYPGQPLVFYKGQYSMQVPVKSTSPFSVDGVNTNVAGITMSNGYYDSIHKMIMGYGDDSASADHVQTYDYGDFWKIFNEKKPVDNIVFDFKYRTQKHNLIDDTTGDNIAASTLTDKYTNGFELLKNFHGRNVDLFGTPLSGDAADPLKTPAVYVVSIGGINDGSSGVENIAGFYATEWRVYAPNDTTSMSTTYKKMSAGNKSSIPPEVLVLNDDGDASFNTSTYPSAVYKTGKYYKITDWKALYQALEDYRGLPVYISYEAADAQNGAEDYQTGTHGATRNDGRWLYSKNGESITSNIKIQYSTDNGATYTDLNTTTPEVEGLSAYFTNTDVYGTQTYATTIDPDKTFNFEAKTTNGEYKFVGWYLDDSNKTLITNDNAGSTERSGSYTFVAKFMLVTDGQLILSHSTDTGTIGGTNYDGAGTVTIAAVVKDGDGATVKTFAPTTSDITLDNKIIKSDNTAYTVDVTLTATRGNNSALGTTILATPDDQESKFFDYGNFTVSADGKTRTYNFTFTVGDLYSGTTQNYMNLIYHSYFKNYVFNYTVNYEFTGRDGEKKIYNRAGTLTAPQAEAYVYKDTVTSGGSEIDMRFLRKEFFESLAPYESNFMQSLTWNFTNKQFTDGTNYVYNCNAHFEAIQNDSNEKVNVTFVLPYEHNDGVATLNNGVGTAAESTNYALINDGTNDNRVAFATIPKLTGGRTNGIYSADDGEKQYWIAAPAKLDTGDFFSHWSIKTTDSNVEVARCYFPGFNFLAYENYVIEAVYGSVESDVSTSGIYTNATYLSTTRNQWNALNSSTAAVPDVEKTDRATAADVLYNDFVLNYHYNDVDIYKNGSDASDINELGVVVERVKELDKNSDDSYDTRISSYTSLSENIDDVKTAANSSADDGKAQDINGSQYYKQRINKNQLDNKNRIQFFEAFYNAAGWDSANQKPVASYKAKRYVYRAYTYIKYNDNGVEKIAISDTPAYFVMYDVATANYSSN